MTKHTHTAESGEGDENSKGSGFQVDGVAGTDVLRPGRLAVRTGRMDQGPIGKVESRRCRAAREAGGRLEGRWKWVRESGFCLTTVACILGFQEDSFRL